MSLHCMKRNPPPKKKTQLNSGASGLTVTREQGTKYQVVMPEVGTSLP